MSSRGRRTICYVVPFYNEAGNIPLLHRTLDEVTAALGGRYDVRFVYVNDGSADDTLLQLHAVRDRDDRVTVIDLSRNFGHQMAVTAGLDHATDADAVVIMDADMQDPPRVSLELIERWEQGYDVVYAQRRSRQDTAFKKATARLFYALIRRVAEIDIPENTGDFRLLDRKVVRELSHFREHDRFLRGLVSYVGFRQVAVPFDRDARHAGTTGYPLRRMLRFAADGIVGFSAVPLRLISKLGYFISLLSVVGLLYTVGVKLFRPEIAVPGWAFLASATFFLGGVQFVMLGVLGSYIGRIYTEVKGRPLYSIASIRPAAGAPSRLDERVERVQRVEPRADGAEVVPSETRA